MDTPRGYIVPHRGKLGYFYSDDENLYCVQYKFNKVSCAFCSECSSTAKLASAKYPNWSLLKCDLVTDVESLVQLPCALLSCQSKSKEIFRFYGLFSDQLKLLSSWKHNTEGKAISKDCIKLGDGPSVLIHDGKYLMYHDRKITCKAFESVKLSKYFDNLTSFNIITTRTTVDNLLIVLISYKSNEQSSDYSAYGLLTIKICETLVLKTCDITSCIPSIYFPVICDIACKRLTLNLDQHGSRTVRSEVYAITSADQLVKFQDGQLKYCGAVQVLEQSLCHLKVFASEDQSFGCVISKDGKCLVIDLDTCKIVDQVEGNICPDGIFVGDFLGNGTEQTVITGSVCSPDVMGFLLTDGASWRSTRSDGTSFTEGTKMLKEKIVVVDANSKTAMMALSNRIMSGRGHLLDLKREGMIREDFIKKICAELTSACKNGSPELRIQDDLLKPFSNEEELIPNPYFTFPTEGETLEVGKTWVRQQSGNIVFGVIVTNLSERAVQGLQLMVTEHDNICEAFKSSSKLIQFASEKDLKELKLHKSSAKKRKKVFTIGLPDLLISSQLSPGNMGYVVAILARSVLNTSCCNFDAFLTWKAEDGSLHYNNVPSFELKISDVLNGSIDIAVPSEIDNEDYQSQLVDLVAFFSTASLIDLVIISRFSRISDIDDILSSFHMTYNAKWNFWFDENGFSHFPSLSKIKVCDTEVVLKVAFRDASQLTLLLVQLYEALPCDVDIQEQCQGTMASQHAHLMKCLHQEVAAIKRQLGKETKEAPAEGATAIDFTGSVDAVRHQVELQKQQLQKRKVTDAQAIEILVQTQTVTDLQTQTDIAAERLV